MAKIGTFSKTEHGYKGRVRTLTPNTEMEIVLSEAGETAPLNTASSLASVRPQTHKPLKKIVYFSSFLRRVCPDLSTLR